MAKQKLDLIVLSSLAHDTGKLFERGEIFSDARKDPTYLGSCPKKPGEQSSHLHAAHTHAFCDWLEERFSCLKDLADKSWKIWCAAHHRNDETGAEASVIRIADRLSSSEREEGQYYQKEVHRRTLLEPVLERVRLENEDCLKTEYRYPLHALGCEKDNLFAVRGKYLGLQSMQGAENAVNDPAKWTHLLAEKPLVDDYAKLGNGLLDEIQALSDQCRNISLPDLIICLSKLLERYTANVPSATNLRHPDISLFDHLRTTAAIAQALWMYQENAGKFLTDFDKNDPLARWLLVCGDLQSDQQGRCQRFAGALLLCGIFLPSLCGLSG